MTEERKKYHREYYHRNKEKILAHTRKWMEKDKLIRPDFYKEKSRKENKKYREKYPEKSKLKMREWRLRNKLLVFNACSGGKIECACCGEKQIEFLSLDHINGDGAKHRQEIATDGKGKRTDVIFTWAIKNNFPSGLQVLCMNCNWAKRIDNICPHKKVGIVAHSPSHEALFVRKELISQL